MVENRKPKFFYGYVIALVGFIIMAIAWGMVFTFGIFLKPLSAELGWTRALTSGAYSLFMLLHGFLYIFTGRLNDKLGPRLVMTVCGLFIGLSYLLMSQVSAIWQLYLFYGVILAVGMSGGFVPLASTITRWFVKRRGLMTGVVVSGAGFGTLIMSPIANWLIADYGWRTSYVMLGIIASVLIISAAQFLRRDPGQMGQVAYGEDTVKVAGLNLQDRGFSLQQAIHTRQFWIVGALFISHLVGQQAILIHIVPHATDLGISAANAAGILAVIGGLSIVGKVLLSSIGDRIGNKRAIIISLSLASMALLWLLVAREVWMLYLFAVVFGLGYGGMAVLESPMVAELFGLRSHGTLLGMIMAGVMAGGAFGALMAGRIFDITGSYQLAFLISMGLSVTGLILTPLLRPTRKQGEEWPGEKHLAHFKR